MSKTKDSLFLGGSQKAWNKQFVWPREGPKGRRPRSFLSGFMDILANRGPDIFIQPKGDTTPIKTDIWSNWDSYHSRDSSLKEQLHSYKGVWNADRKTKRYDPHKRQYVEWEWDQNWAEDPLLMRPKFHKGEHEFMARNPGKVPRKNFQHGRPMVCLSSTRHEVTLL